jgi:hypothetical protein
VLYWPCISQMHQAHLSPSEPIWTHLNPSEPIQAHPLYHDYISTDTNCISQHLTIVWHLFFVVTTAFRSCEILRGCELIAFCAKCRRQCSQNWLLEALVGQDQLDLRMRCSNRSNPFKIKELWTMWTCMNSQLYYELV